jgi:hypothetical protein
MNYPMMQGYQPMTGIYQPYGLSAQQRLAQMEQQFQQNYMPQPQIQPMPNVTWIPVSGLQGAKEHIVQPNSTAWLMDNNETVFYVKSSDALGVTTLKAYRFQEIGLDSTNAQQSQINLDQFVQREEFDRLKEQINHLTASIQTPVVVNNNKGDKK